MSKAEASLGWIEVASEGSREVLEFWLCATRQTQRAVLEVWDAWSGGTERPLERVHRQTDHHPAGAVSVATSLKIGYCMKCKAQREIQNSRQITMKNGRPAIEGTCPACSTKMFKIGAIE